MLPRFRQTADAGSTLGANGWGGLRFCFWIRQGTLHYCKSTDALRGLAKAKDIKLFKRADCPRSYPGLLPMPPEPSERLAAARFRVGGHRARGGHQGRRLGSLGVLRAARGLGLSD